MKYQVLFSLKNKMNFRIWSALNLHRALRINQNVQGPDYVAA